MSERGEGEKKIGANDDCPLLLGVDSVLLNWEHLGHFWHFGGGFESTAESTRAWSTSVLENCWVLWQQASFQNCLVVVLTASLGALFDSIVRQGAWFDQWPWRTRAGS